MDPDDALPSAIRRSPAASFEQRKQSLYHTTPRSSSDDSDESPDEAAPPPISRSRSNSLGIQHVAHTRPEQDPVLHAESLPNLPPTEPAPPVPPRHKFQYPNRSKPENLQALQTVSRTSRRSPRGLVSYRTNKKIPLHLRRQPSLETIASVTTTASEDCHDPPEAEAPSPDWFTQEDDPSTTPVPGSKASSAYAPSTSSQESHTADMTPLETPLEFGSLGRHSPQSLFRKMMPRKADHVSSSSPHRLIIEKSTSIDRTTTPSSTSQPAESFTNGSNISLPPAPASSDRSLASGVISVEPCQSGSSSEWSASSFDVGTLTEAQLKRCRKKGINPALYAEMRAAKGKKWTSPIAGNTFL